jgi:hypothetical protein
MAGFFVLLGGIILIVLCVVAVPDKERTKKVRNEQELKS